MYSILNSFAKIAENEGVTITKFERDLGMSKGLLSRAIKHKRDIGLKWLQVLVEYYPSYRKEWILTGEGPMLITELETSSKIEVIELLKQQLIEKEKELERVNRELGMMEERLLNYKKTGDLLPPMPELALSQFAPIEYEREEFLTLNIEPIEENKKEVDKTSDSVKNA